MSGSIFGQILILLILIALSGFFSASETALMSLSKIRIRHMVDDGVKKAELIQRMTGNPSSLLGTVLVGNTVINIGSSSLATAIAISLFGDSGVGIATVVMTILVLVFAEITPKSLAAQNSEAFSVRVAGLMSFFVKFLRPIVAVFTYITSIFIKLLGGKASKDRPFITEEELKTMVEVSQEEGVLEMGEKEMLYNVFEFGDLQVRDVMVQRIDIIAIDLTADFEEIMKVIKEEQFSRIVVYRDNIDDVVGILNVKDLFFIDKEQEFSIDKYMREPMFTFEFKKVTEVLKDMKKERTHMAVVLDEYGGTAGIITIEDMLEEIVGEIQDEYDELEQDEIFVVKEDEYIVEGSTRIELVNEMLGIHIETEEFDSIGGYVIGILGRLPEEKEEIEDEGIKYIVESLEKNRIKKIRIIT